MYITGLSSHARPSYKLYLVKMLAHFGRVGSFLGLGRRLLYRDGQKVLAEDGILARITRLDSQINP